MDDSYTPPEQIAVCPACGQIKEIINVDLDDAGYEKIKCIKFYDKGFQHFKSLDTYRINSGAYMLPVMMFAMHGYISDGDTEERTLLSLKTAYKNTLKVCGECYDVAMIGDKWVSEKDLLRSSIEKNIVGFVRGIARFQPNMLSNAAVINSLLLNDKPDEIIELVVKHTDNIKRTNMFNHFCRNTNTKIEPAGLTFLPAFMKAGMNVNEIDKTALKYVLEFLPLEDQKRICAEVFLHTIREN